MKKLFLFTFILINLSSFFHKTQPSTIIFGFTTFDNRKYFYESLYPIPSYVTRKEFFIYNSLYRLKFEIPNHLAKHFIYFVENQSNQKNLIHNVTVV